MKVSYNWLQKEYFNHTLPPADKIRDLLTMHSFEIESLEVKSDDVVLDIKVLPDRSHDCLSHWGIAQEISVLSGIPLKSKISSNKDNAFPESNVFRAEVSDPLQCPRFSVLVIENIEVGESPRWLKESLEAIGQRSINNIVDATNYVMFSIGQPLHAYDRERLEEGNEGWKLLVRGALQNETISALDGKEYKLIEGQLVIADGNTNLPLGIAGVKGGKASEISKNTKNIIVEAANFDPVTIRQSAKKINLRTDASIRFENGISPELTILALHQVAQIILDIAKTDTSKVEGLFDFYPKKPNLYKVGVSLREINRLLGTTMDQKAVESILDRRGYEWKYISPREEIITLAPQFIGVPYKYGASVVFDSPKAFDCSSFSSFLYANAGVAIPRVSIEQFLFGITITQNEARPGDLVFSKGSKPYFFKEEPRGIGHVGIYLGDNQVIHASGSSHFNKVEKEDLSSSDSFNSEDFRGFRRILTSDENRFVVTIPPERLDLRIKEDLIEEIGRLYGYTQLASRPIDTLEISPEVNKRIFYLNIIRRFFVERGFSEIMTYAFTDKGFQELQNPIAQDKSYLRSTLITGMETALEGNAKNLDLLGLEQVKLFEIGTVFNKESEYTALAFGIRNTKEYRGLALEGEIQKIIEDLEKKLDTKISFFPSANIVEINIDSLIAVLEKPSQDLSFHDLPVVRFQNFSQYPFILRDLAVFIPEGAHSQEIINIVKQEAGNLLVNWRQFDVFAKDFPDGRKISYAHRLVFQSYEKTLTDEEINVIMTKVSQQLNSREGWSVR